MVHHDYFCTKSASFAHCTHAHLSLWLVQFVMWRNNQDSLMYIYPLCYSMYIPHYFNNWVVGHLLATKVSILQANCHLPEGCGYIIIMQANDERGSWADKLDSYKTLTVVQLTMYASHETQLRYWYEQIHGACTGLPVLVHSKYTCQRMQQLY